MSKCSPVLEKKPSRCRGTPLHAARGRLRQCVVTSGPCGLCIESQPVSKEEKNKTETKPRQTGLSDSSKLGISQPLQGTSWSQTSKPSVAFSQAELQLEKRHRSQRQWVTLRAQDSAGLGFLPVTQSASDSERWAFLFYCTMSSFISSSLFIDALWPGQALT